MAKVLNKASKQIGVTGPVLTIVMDGVGLAPATEATKQLWQNVLDLFAKEQSICN